MFSRLKPKDFRLSISTRIALIFCILTFLIVSLSTYLITGLLKTTVLSQKSDELIEHTKRISSEFMDEETQSEFITLAIKLTQEEPNYWQNLQMSFDAVDRHVRQARIPYYISYTVYFVTQYGTPVLLAVRKTGRPRLNLQTECSPSAL